MLPILLYFIITMKGHISGLTSKERSKFFFCVSIRFIGKLSTRFHKQMRLTHIIYRLPTISATYDYCYCIIKGKIIHSEQHSKDGSEKEK
jgi:hypothetical protein